MGLMVLVEPIFPRVHSRETGQADSDKGGKASAGFLIKTVVKSQGETDGKVVPYRCVEVEFRASSQKAATQGHPFQAVRLFADKNPSTPT